MQTIDKILSLNEKTISIRQLNKLYSRPDLVTFMQIANNKYYIKLRNNHCIIVYVKENK